MEKKLFKSRKHRMLTGVCGGIAEYANIDPTVIRLFCVLFGLACGLGVIFYICAVFIIPKNPEMIRE